MVERQGGRLTIEPPAAHRGMRYRITLPLRAVDPAAAPSPEVAANGEAAAPPEPWREDALAGQRVLVVDDLADARDSLALLLETAGAQVVSFGSGHEAIDWLTARPTNEWPQLLVCDLLLGDQEDGHTVMQAIRQLEARRGVDLAQRMPALALSGLARPEGRLRAMLAGFQSHLGKPVGGAQLIETLRRLAGREVAA
ncbi:MAG TPA: response regulator [Ideonella sp.]|uniref:response regulator n=1 Tax=Ideonella sp. TaxID=1929293 RepID=UPI002C314ECC|nr:response regulator [Ideonella sp.]HSI51842.1 response regulator [Ideonella sp.]